MQACFGVHFNIFNKRPNWDLCSPAVKEKHHDNVGIAEKERMSINVRLIISRLFFETYDMQTSRKSNKDIHDGQQRFHNQTA